MNRNRFNGITWGIISGAIAIALAVWVSTWWGYVLAIPFAMLSLGGFRLGIRGLPPDFDKWEALAQEVSRSECKICGAPLSLAGTNRVAILARVQSVEELLARFGVLCNDHSADVIDAMLAEGKVTPQQVEDSFAHAAQATQEHYARALRGKP